MNGTALGEIQRRIAQAVSEVQSNRHVTIPDSTQAFLAGMLYPRAEELTANPQFGDSIHRGALELFTRVIADRTKNIEIKIEDLTELYDWPEPWEKAPGT
jgi:hypothetical protein